MLSSTRLMSTFSAFIIMIAFVTTIFLVIVARVIVFGQSLKRVVQLGRRPAMALGPIDCSPVRLLR